MSIYNSSKQTTIAEKVIIADTFKQRMLGLLNRSHLDQDEALVIKRCNSIHMFFMKFPIDVIFADRNDQVVGLVENIKPFRLSPVFFKASYCIELPVGSIEKSQTVVGDQLKTE